MAAVVNPELVYKQIENNKFSIYTIKSNGNIVDMNNEKSLGFEDVINRIRATLDNIEGGTVEIAFYQLERGEKAGGGRVTPIMAFTVAIPKENKTTAITGVTASNADLKTALEKNYELQLQLKELQFKHEMENLRREIKESKTEDETGGIGALLKPYLPELIPLIISGFGGKGVRGIAGHKPGGMTIVTENEAPDQLPDELPEIKKTVPAAEEDEEYTKEDEIIDAAVSRLVVLDPDFHNTITKLAEFASKYPEKYKQYLPLLSV